MKKHGRFVAGVFGASVLLALGTGAFLTANGTDVKEANAAGEFTYSWNASNANANDFQSPGTITLDGKVWNWDATVGYTGKSSNCVQLGSGKKAFSGGNLSIDSFDLFGESVGITSVKLGVSSANASASVSATVGDQTIIKEVKTSKWTTVGVVSGTFDDPVGGVLTLSFGTSSGAFYLSSIEVTGQDMITYDHIDIVGEPQKEYALGDSFSTDGLEVYAYETAEATEGTLLDASDFAWTVEGDDFSTVGTKTVKVTATYGELTASVTYDDVQVIDKHIVSLAISGDLENKAVKKGDVVDFTGLTVTAIYNDESTADVTSDVAWSANYSAYDYSYITELDVTASLDGITSDPFKVAGITVTVEDLYLLAEGDSDIYDGAVVVMASNKGHIGKYVGRGNYVPVDNTLGTVSGNEFIPNGDYLDEIGFITLEAGPEAGQYYLKQGDLYLTAYSTTENYLAGRTDKSDEALFNISVVNGVVEATNVGNTTKDILSFNATYPRFSCYGSKQKNGDVYFYVRTEGEIDLDENAAAFRDAMLTGINCDPTGVSAPSASEWESAADAYEQMLDYHKDLFSNAAADEAGNVFEQVAAKYDYILSKYGVEAYSNFMNRDVVNMSGRLNVTFDDANTWFALAGILAIGAAASAALVIANKRRKAE